MKEQKSAFCLLLALVLCLCLAACGGENGSDDLYEPDDPRNSWDILTDIDFDEKRSSWQGDDGSQLLICLDQNNYTLHTWYGRTGLGELFQDEGGLGVKTCDMYGDRYYYLVREGSGFTVRHVNGEEGSEWGELNGVHFEPSLEEVAPFDPTPLNGMWQNAYGKTYAYNIQLMRFIACSSDSLSNTALYDDYGGCGIYMGGSELLFPCLSADGNSFVLFGADNTPREPGARSTGVFYRNGDVEAYADLENACFEESEGRIWYYDGMQYFALPEGYTLGEDGQAYDRTNKPFARDWDEERFDPASVWGENWMEENWGSNNGG